MAKYLGYMFIDPLTGSEGYGGYSDYAICSGDSPEEVIKDWCNKTGNKFIESNIWINKNNEDDFAYHDYFDILFIKLPEQNIYKPNHLKLKYK